MTTGGKQMRTGRCLVTVVLLAALGLAIGAANGGAAGVEVESFSAGVSQLHAGAHADATAQFRLATETVPGPLGQPPLCGGTGCPLVVKGGAPKEIVVELPRGLIGNPQVAPQCAIDELTNYRCPVTSQVGYLDLHFLLGGIVETNPTAIFNMKPERGEVAKFGFRAVSGAVNSFIGVTLRDGDLGLRTTVYNIYDGNPVVGSDIEIWGVPHDTSHDSRRACFNAPSAFGCPANVTPRPFLANPAECEVDGFATLKVRNWRDPDAVTTATSTPQQLSGCERQVFAPTITASPDNSERGKAFGLTFGIEVPQTWESVRGLATPPLRDATVTMPDGVAISSSSWPGLQGCSDAQLGVGRPDPVACPLASKIGEVEVVTPLLSEVLTGGIYLGTQESDDPLSGRLFRIALQLVNEERGLNVKIPGSIAVDPITGRITARFRNNPQLPFSRLTVRFKGGERAPLSMPMTCGPATTTAVLTGWGVEDRPVTAQTSFNTTHGGSSSPCPLDFSPSFEAGVIDPVATESSPFTLRFGRDDGDEELRNLTVEMPPGQLARIADVPLCPEANAAAGTCDASSRIGTVTSFVGPGSTPPYVPGRVYIGGEYNGAPYSLVIVVPAVVGPFDLGTVVIRAGAYVDRVDASLRIVSDPLPLSLKGVPFRIREVVVDIDRPRFMVNPSNCEPMRVEATIGSASGRTVAVGSRYQLGECAVPAFTPKMTLRVGRRGSPPRASRTTPLEVSLTMPPGQANNRVVQVNLPRTLNSRLEVINASAGCTPAQFAADRCTVSIGTAQAVTPLLRQPVTGKIYLVRNPARRLPDMMLKLRGQGDARLVEIELVGRILITRQLTILTTFDAVPDVPVTKFTMRLISGRFGAIGSIYDLCGARRRRQSVARLAFTAHSGKRVARNQQLSVVGCGRATRGGRRARRGRARRSALAAAVREVK